MQGADLSGADLAGSNLEGADLRDAKLDGVKLMGTRLANAKIDEKWRIVWEVVNNGAAGRDLRGADLKAANLAAADLAWLLEPGSADSGGAVLVASHDDSIESYADKCFTLQDGSLTEKSRQP